MFDARIFPTNLGERGIRGTLMTGKTEQRFLILFSLIAVKFH
jgi:hypothetical protein